MFVNEIKSMNKTSQKNIEATRKAIAELEDLEFNELPDIDEEIDEIKRILRDYQEASGASVVADEDTEIITHDETERLVREVLEKEGLKGLCDFLHIKFGEYRYFLYKKYIDEVTDIEQDDFESMRKILIEELKDELEKVDK